MNPEKVREMTMRAIRLDGEGRFIEAVQVFRALLASEPQSAIHHLNLGCLYLNHRKYEAAIEELSLACRLGPELSHGFFNLGLAYYALDQLALAARQFVRARALEPGFVPSSIMAALCLSRLGLTEQAQPFVPPLVVAQSLEPDMCNFFALALQGVKRAQDAESVLRGLLRRLPGHRSTVVNLANCLELANKVDEAAELLGQIPPANLDAFGRSVMARLLYRKGEYGQAAAQLRQLLESGEASTAQFRSGLEFEYGKCMDASGDYAAAVRAFETGNRLVRDYIARENGTDDSHAMPWEQDFPELDAHVMRLRAAQGPAGESPIFVVGFPRSGTTLIDQILDAHPALQVLDEKPVLDSVVDLLAERPEGYPQALQSLEPGELEALRARYWSSVAQYLERRPGARLVDKNPFNFCRLQLIMALFPEARLIFVTRHPCDVVLSCFMQNFGFSDATRGFWTIGDSAQIYDRAISIWLLQRARLKPECLDLWYEDVVVDLPLQLRRMAEFLGIEVDPAMLDFHRHAQSRRINTPSYSQVVRPLYGSSVQRWHRYRPWFAAVEPRLLELAGLMGYPRPQAEAETMA